MDKVIQSNETTARAVLTMCGIHRGADFQALTQEQVDSLRRAGVSSGALRSGNMTVSMYHTILQRQAKG